MSYRVQLSRQAEKTLNQLDHTIYHRIRAKLLILTQQARPPGCKKLKGELELYRLRVGDYRIIYEVHDQELLVLVVKVSHRQTAYHD